MTTPLTEPLFIENLRAPGWMFAFLGIMLGVASGGLTAVGIRSLTDEPILSGSDALIFYFAFAIGIVGIVYVMLNSTLMETRITEDGIKVRLGVLGTQRTFSWDTISTVRTTDHNIARHGGRGNPFAPSSRKSWMMYGFRSGIEIESSDGTGTTVYFVSSSRADELAKVAADRLLQS